MYTVYVHIFPNNKKYVGVTKQSLEKRFGKNGNGYRASMMQEAISQFGWENITHKVLKENLTYEQAVKWEQHYIKKYKTNDYEYGYNKNKGGAFSKNPKSYIHKNTPNRQKWYDKQKNTPLSEETKRKMKDAHAKRLNRYICQYEDDNLIKKWNTANEIQVSLGYSRAWILICCDYNEKGKPYKKAYNYIWKYEKREG